MATETVTFAYTRGGQTFTTTVQVTDPVNPGLPSGVTLQPLDGGGLAYYNAFTPRFPADNFFPIAVWYQGARNAADIATDKSCGLNTYVLLDNGSVPSLIKAAGMYSVGGPISGQTTENVGYHIDDEVDMSASGWYGAPTAAQFTTLQNDLNGVAKGTRFTHANFGKGIMFSSSDADSSRMVNMLDVVSNDEYWFTDADLFGANQGGKLFGLGRDMTNTETRRASNYGATVRRMRKLVNYAKPVWGFVEMGGPFGYNTATNYPYITAAQMRAATWSQIIAGATGVIYFAHTFGTVDQSTAIQRQASVARYTPIVAMMKTVNAQIASFAGVLNQPNAAGLVTATGVDVMAKWNNGSPVIFAGSQQNANTTPQFTLLGGPWTTATVDGESRTIPIVNGKFSDNFADGNAVHIYRIS